MPEACASGLPGLSAPIFDFGENLPLPDSDLHLRDLLPKGTFALAGPGATAEAGHLPVRGDLAHIRLAGRYFVPHYAEPMAHRVSAPAVLRKSGTDTADAIEPLASGTLFNVLDMSGGWAWGQVGEDGFVGYLPLGVLEAT